jgi:hypothetical protein
MIRDDQAFVIDGGASRYGREMVWSSARRISLFLSQRVLALREDKRRAIGSVGDDVTHRRESRSDDAVEVHFDRNRSPERV